MLKYSIRFTLQSKAPTTKETVLRCWACYNATKTVFNSGLRIEPRFWNHKAQEARVNILFPDAGKFTADVKQVRKWAENAFEDMVNETQAYPDIEALKERCLSYIINKGAPKGVVKKDMTFVEYIDVIINDSKSGKRQMGSGRQYGSGIIKSYVTSKRNLEAFTIYSKRKPLTFADINLEFYNDYKDWCYTVKMFADNTFGKLIRDIKTFMNEGIDAGLHDNVSHRHKKFIMVSVEVDNIYLDEETLTMIANFNFSENKKWQRVVDSFLVGCYTGLRFSDFNNIKPNNIKDGLIEIKTQKTGEMVAIPIHPVVSKVMERYKGQTANSLPPSISDVKFNLYIKEAAKETKKLDEVISLTRARAGKRIVINKPLHELITSHTARRSFATNMFRLGVPSFIIMAVTGHRTEKSFIKYIKVSPREKATIMLEHWNRQGMKVAE